MSAEALDGLVTTHFDTRKNDVKELAELARLQHVNAARAKRTCLSQCADV